MPESTERGALTEAVYYILLALHSPMHGYGIMQYVKELSNDRVNLGPGTLYGAINTLIEKGWIKALSSPGNSRKKEYEITLKGRETVLLEIERLEELLAHGKKIARRDA
ncbi:PadR family transcriptional regulator [Desulfosporosinus meridiei]|uniref:Putative transcriptional regulator n=1 Tax=Desulfosporosinus meridiei (strain ATCC BAA-275 / DSM 13257 / KCTC 12902 / NCIMB 13706 / S10) TaxID=768704 RepID=J7J268_DESMD|nr:helix-turn-helix transcriptional regulator [Desulfosporosinus meridiei]AFQ45383.1 putative transcriptional regulator [Desulfosporosinus meridiei DSM 13257]